VTVDDIVAADARARMVAATVIADTFKW
jgi:hypothetical protein